MNHTHNKYILKYILLKLALRDYAIGYRLPSENALSSRFKVTRSTVRSVYKKIKAYGLIKPIQGSGYMVQRDFFNYFFPYDSSLSSFGKPKINITHSSIEDTIFEFRYYDENNNLLGYCDWKIFHYTNDLPSSLYNLFEILVKKSNDVFENLEIEYNNLYSKNTNLNLWAKQSIYGPNNELKWEIILGINSNNFKFQTTWPLF